MTAPEGYRLIDLPSDRIDEVMRISQWGFAYSIADTDAPEVARGFNVNRGRGIEVADAVRGEVGSLVGIHSSMEHHMRVPGGAAVPTAGLAWVSVHQGHRRRGLLSAMMSDHWTRSRARGEVISTLYAAEPAIYQRFGYGLATQAYSLTLGRRPALKHVPGADQLTVRLEDSSEDIHAPIVAAVQRRLQRPGVMVTIDPCVQAEMFRDLPADRGGAERRRIAIVEDEQGPAAYALFSRNSSWVDSQPAGLTTVTTWGSAHGAATHQLISVIADLDLMVQAKVAKVAPDDELLVLLQDTRAVKPLLVDNLWLRILDVKAALEARTYAQDLTVAFEVADAHIPDNATVWVMTVNDAIATVERADRGTTPEFSLTINDLSAAYLGGATLESMAQAGTVVEGKSGSVRALSRAMRSDLAPVSNIGF